MYLSLNLPPAPVARWSKSWTAVAAGDCTSGVLFTPTDPLAP